MEDDVENIMKSSEKLIFCSKCDWRSVVDLNARYVEISKITNGISFLFPVAEPKFTFINCPNCGTQINLTEKKN